MAVLVLDELGDGFSVLGGDEAPDDAPLAGELVTTSHGVPFAGVKPRSENARKRLAILGKALHSTRVKLP